MDGDEKWDAVRGFVRVICRGREGCCGVCGRGIGVDCEKGSECTEMELWQLRVVCREMRGVGVVVRDACKRWDRGMAVFSSPRMRNMCRQMTDGYESAG